MPDSAHPTVRLACAMAACLGMAACGNDEVVAPPPVAGTAPPGSLGADGFATVAADGRRFIVTGGAAADAAHTYTVRNRAELVAALYGKAGADPAVDVPDDTAKTLLIQGSIDLNADAGNQPTSPDTDLRACTASFASAAGFYAAYKVLYDPGLWTRQSLDVDNKPPALPFVELDGSPSLEGIRLCARLRQTDRVTMRVGSNTSILGLGTDARILHGMIRIGDFKVLRDPPIIGAPVRDSNGATVLEQERQAVNVVIRNITFEDAYDHWPAWDPKDSFSIAAADFGVGRCAAVFDVATDTGPHQCPSRKGGRWNAEYDMIGVVNGSQIWIDHNSFSDGARTDDQDPPVPEWAAPFNAREQKIQHHDGAVDVTQAASRVTLSFNHFRNHDKTSLIGGSDTAQRFATTRNGVAAVLGAGPDQLSVTFHHNLFEDSTQRMPRVRFGKAHVFNNVFLGQVKPSSSSLAVPPYAWSVGYTISTASKLFVESNVFEIRPGAAGDTLPGAAKLTFGDTVASTLANQARCVAAGYSAADCGTYFFESGTLFNGSMVPPGTTLAAAQAKGGGASNAVVLLLDESYWTPGQDYSYSTDDVNGVKARVQAGAGAGKL